MARIDVVGLGYDIIRVFNYLVQSLWSYVSNILFNILLV